MRLTYLIGQLDRVVSRRLGETLSGHGLTLAQFTALSVLNARGPLSNAQLAERSFIAPQSANEVVKVMEANGWVMREVDPTNRRIVLLRLTPHGRKTYRHCANSVDEVERAMLEGMTSENHDSLYHMLVKCVSNLRMS